MPRFLTIALSLFLFSLACMPCRDIGKPEAVQAHEATHHHDHDHEEHPGQDNRGHEHSHDGKDGCSTLCSCSCCGINMVLHDGKIVLTAYPAVFWETGWEPSGLHPYTVVQEIWRPPAQVLT